MGPSNRIDTGREGPVAGGGSALWGDPVFGALARGLYQRCGLVFEGGQAHLFRKRVERRAGELGHPDATRYLTQLGLAGDEAEYERLIELLTVNETYFFREEEHFQIVLERYWQRWARGPDDPLRVWSAACSTGCEPYTLAMLLLEKGMLRSGWPAAEILASDINGRVVEDARRGIYGEFSLRNTPEYYRGKYFRKEGTGYRLDPNVAQMVKFQKVNLLKSAGALPGGGFHAIFCRNVLIYFDLEAKRRVISALTRALKPGGILIVGRSESLFNIPEAPPLVNHGGILIHEKPELGARPGLGRDR